MNKTIEIHGLGAKPLIFVEVQDLTHNTREISFTGSYNGHHVTVNKLKPSGLLLLDITDDEKVADDNPNPLSMQGNPMPQAQPLSDTDNSLLIGKKQLDNSNPLSMQGNPMPGNPNPPPTPGNPNPPPMPPTPQATPTVHTKQQLYDLVSKLFDEGKDIVGKGLQPLGFDTVVTVPDEKIDEVYNFIMTESGLV